SALEFGRSVLELAPGNESVLREYRETVIEFARELQDQELFEDAQLRISPVLIELKALVRADAKRDVRELLGRGLQVHADILLSLAQPKLAVQELGDAIGIYGALSDEVPQDV